MVSNLYWERNHLDVAIYLLDKIVSPSDGTIRGRLYKTRVPSVSAWNVCISIFNILPLLGVVKNFHGKKRWDLSKIHWTDVMLCLNINLTFVRCCVIGYTSYMSQALQENLDVHNYRQSQVIDIKGAVQDHNCYNSCHL